MTFLSSLGSFGSSSTLRRPSRSATEDSFSAISSRAISRISASVSVWSISRASSSWLRVVRSSRKVSMIGLSSACRWPAVRAAAWSPAA
jgi:hypothetical protein